MYEDYNDFSAVAKAMADKKRKEVTISCRLDEELYLELRSRAHHQRRSQKSIIEEALRLLFAHVEK